MLRWIDVIKYAKQGNPTPPHKDIRTPEEWAAMLSPEVYRITRLHGTERPHSSDMCTSFAAGLYGCACCGTLLFDAREKYDSGTGWPSFTQPYTIEAISYHEDRALSMRRIEVRCNTCDAHLGHVFPDGPAPSGLRYCINALALKKKDTHLRKAVIGGGCFWCTHALFNKLEGVLSVRSGYSGGQISNPTYKEVCSGLTGHAEGIEITYDPTIVSYRELLDIHLETHDPTTLNQQGADRGTQYRSVVFHESEEEKTIAQAAIAEAQARYKDPIVTTIEPYQVFYEAEPYHQDYYDKAPTERYCQIVISPKLEKFKSKFADKLKEA